MSPVLSSFSAEDIISTIPDPLVVIDGDGIVTFANIAFEEKLGYPRSRVRNKHYLNIDVLRRSSAEQQRILKEGFESLLRGESIDPIEVTLVTESSSKVSGLITFFSLEDQSQRMRWFVASFKDLTDLKEAHEKIRKSEERYRRLFENAKVGMFHTKLSDGRIIRCNEIGAKLLGFEKPEQARDFIVSEHYVDSDVRQQLLDGLMETGDVTNFQAQMTQQDGTLIWIEVSGVLYPDEDILESIIIDITERKKVEDALRESEERFRTFVEGSEHGYLVFQGIPPRIIYSNPSLSRIIGFTENELMSMTIDDIQTHLSEDFQEEAMSYVDAALKESVLLPLSNEFQFERKDGTQIWVRTDSSIITLNNEPALQMLVVDITEQRKLTDALRESEKKFHLFADYFPGALFMKDKDSRFVFVNTFVKTVFGETDFVDKTPYDVYIDQEIAQRHMNEDQRVLQGEVIEQVETLPDIYGNEYVYRTTMFPISREDGTTLIGGLSIDITSLKETEQALQLTQFSIDNTADPAFWTDDTAMIVYANNAACKNLGYAQEDLVGMSLYEFDLETTEEGWIQFLEEMRKTKAKTFESRFRRKDGDEFPVEISVNYLNFDDSIFLFAVAKDITERRKIETALRMTQYSIDTANDPVFWVDPEGKLTYVNEAGTRMLGYTKDELFQLTIFDVDTIYTREKWSSLFETIQETKAITFETTLKGKAGHEFPAEISVTIFDFEGQELLFAYIKDITERMTVLKELENALDHAEFFVDLMGHDLTNINQAVMGLLEVILIDDTLLSQTKGLVDRSISQVRRATDLITKVQKFRRIGKSSTPLSAQDPAEALSSAVSKVEEVMLDKKLILQSSLEPGMFSVLGDEFLPDVFYNLLHNVMQNDSQESVIVDILADLDDDGNSLRISIVDRGKGVPDKLKEFLFDRISKKKEGFWGTGMGLTLVKRIIDHYGGSIHLEDRIEGDHTQGARIVMLIPNASYPEMKQE